MFLTLLKSRLGKFSFQGGMFRMIFSPSKSVVFFRARPIANVYELD